MTPIEKLRSLSKEARHLVLYRAGLWARHAGVEKDWALAVLLDRVQPGSVRPTHGAGH